MSLGTVYSEVQTGTKQSERLREEGEMGRNRPQELFV